MTMSEDELDSEEDAQYGDEEESSDEPLQEISDDDESDGGEDAEGDDADDDSPSDPDASDAPFNNISRSQQAAPLPSSRSSSPTHIRRSLFRTNIVPKSYAIEPICALPHPAATHSLASSLCMTHLLTGSHDGFIRDYDVFAGANGKTVLTAPQRHHAGLADASIKAGVLRSWWENPEGESSLSPVYSMAVQADSLWGLSATESGALNLFTIRHDPGRVHHVLRGHTKPVSSLSLSHDEMGVYSAGWDGFALHWDLNTGQIARKYPSHGAQLTTIAVRPLGAPLPAHYGTMINAGGMNGYSDPAPNGSSSTNPNATTHHPGASPPPDAVEDAAGDTDNDFDPLFDDESVHGGEAPASATMAPAPAGAGMVQNGNHANTLQLHVPGTTQPPAPSGNQPLPPPSAPKKEAPILDPVTYADYSPDIFMTASIDGQVTLWDRRAPPGRGVGRLEGNEKSPPWCVSACWSADGAQIYAGRRNGTIDVWDVRKYGPGSGKGQPRLLKTLRNPASSGSVVCVAAFPDRQHIVCASQDNIRLWNVASEDPDTGMHKSRPFAPFKIIAGHHGGIISQILVDATSKFMITASGNRGWFGDSTKTVIVHSITPQ